MKRRSPIGPLRLAALIALVAGCTSGTPGASDGGPSFTDASWEPDAGTPTFTWLYDNIFHGFCADRNQPCHNPGMNRGVSFANRGAAFQSVQHFHIHLIPRYTNDGRGMDWTPTPGNREEILANAEKIKGALGGRA